MRKHSYTLLLSVAMLLVSLGCNLEKEVQIELPDYERELVVECYLEVGKPFRLLVTESIGFFEDVDTPIVTGAKVVISHDGIHDTLMAGGYFEPLGFKVFNFGSTKIVPQDYDTEYELLLTHPDGRVVVGKAKVMKPVEMGSLRLSYNADSMASLTMSWPDYAGEPNYYRLSLHKGTVFNGDLDNSPLEFDFTLDDRIGDGQNFTIGTLFDFKSGDTLISTVYHISEGYWRYINSLSDAASSNGNPFAQPGVIHSTVSGGLGVFTGYDYDRDTIIVP